MSNRNITLYVIIFCIVSLFFGLPFAEAYPDPEANDFAYTTALANRNGAYGEKAVWKDRYDEAHALVQALLNQWSSNEQAIKDDTWDTVDAATATLIAELVKRANTDSSDEMAEQIVEWLPSVYGTYQTAKKAISRDRKTAKRADYLLALNDAVGVLDEVHAENQKAFNNYEKKYDVYLKIMVEHIDGLARVPNHSPEGDYSSVTAWSLDDVKTEVKAKDAFNLTDSKNKFMFWYHPGDLQRTSQPTNHTIDRFYHFGLWKRKELSSDQLCGGDCGRQFQTPVEHLVICPHALPQDAQIRDGQVTPAGCNRAYYTCKNDDRNEHRVRLCTKNKDDPNNAGQKTLCMEPYRNCKNPTYDHVSDSPGSSKHSDGRGRLVTDPTGVQNNAAPGDSQTIVCNIQGCTLTDAYDPSDTSAAALHEYCYSCYQYKCNGSNHSAASCGISGHHACDNNRHVAASCGHSLHFVCDSLTHVEEQCSNTSNGVRCTYQFWRCLHPSVPSYGPSHTCVYPVSCGRSACTQTVTSSTQHSATCASGHSYWTCNPSDVSLHITRTCRLSTCGKSWERCSTVGGTPLCDDPWRRSNGLPCWKK